MFTETQLKMITPNGNIYRYIGSNIVDEFNVGDCADISFPNGYGKGKRTFQGVAPCLNTTTTASCFIVKEDVMNLKEELCKHLIDNNLVEEFDVIKHSYSTSRMNDWKKRNVETNNISPTLTTRSGAYAAGMVLVKDPNEQVAEIRRDEGIRTFKENCCGSLRTIDACGDKVILIKEATKQGYKEAHDGDGVNVSGRMKYQRGNVQEQSIQSLTTIGGNERAVVLDEDKWSDLD